MLAGSIVSESVMRHIMVAKGMVEQNCSPDGSQEAERDREGPRTGCKSEGHVPTDLLPPTRPQLWKYLPFQ
jgi:hypothetical protein